MDFELFFQSGANWSERVQIQEKTLQEERYDVLDAFRTFILTNPSIFEGDMAFWSFFTEISVFAYSGEGVEMAENQQDLEWLQNLHMCVKNQPLTFPGRK